MTFWFTLGTAAELIKIYPVIDQANSRGIDWRLLSTGQSGVNLWKQFEDFELPKDRALSLMATDTDLSGSLMALKWFLRAACRTRNGLREFLSAKAGKAPVSGDYWFVHGDTLSTLLGSIYGRKLKVPVVHVEAGMRSHDIWHPFPEEISRRIVSKLATYHMAPDENAAKNLRGENVTRNVVVTNGNTVMDALAVALQRVKPKDLPKGAYAVANIHRFENLTSAARWNKIIDVLTAAAKRIPIHLVMMPNTVEKLNEDRAARGRLEAAGITLRSRLPFSQFAHLMHNAKFMITDGGSNQQECFHLGLPCLILREKTESLEGIGTCCVLSRFNDDVIDGFLANPQKFRFEPPHVARRPTDIVFENLGLP